MFDSAPRLLFLVSVLASSFVAQYPAAPRSADSDTYFGTRVADPYRWLERIDAPATKRWVGEETAQTEEVLSTMPDRSRMRTLVLQLMGAESDSLPQSGGGILAFARSNGNGRLPYVVVKNRRDEQIEIDPNQRWPSGSTSLSDWRLSPNGRYIAYATKEGGGGLVRWHTLDLVEHRDVDDETTGTPDWAPIIWSASGNGFYYGGYVNGTLPPPGASIGKGYVVRFHLIHSPQALDRLVFAPTNPSWLGYAELSNDGRYEIVGAVDGSGNGKYLGIRDLRQAHPRLQKIRGDRYDYVAAVGSTMYFFTHVGSPQGQLVAIDIGMPQRQQTIIPASGQTLEEVTAVGHTFVARYLQDDRSHLVTFDYGGSRLGDIPLPGPGSVPQIRGSQSQSTAYFQFSNPTSPPITFAYNAEMRSIRVVGRQSAPFDTSKYLTEEFFARSADGTRIPIFVAHRRGIPMDGSVPTMLTGYGGFGDPYEPRWGSLGAAWLASGGTFVIACVRGGGEYGEAWHRAGMLGNKHHAFDDLDAAAKFLIGKRFSSPKKLALYGYSGGGLLVGATEVEHPDHFGAVVEAAGPVDVIRGHLYGSESAWIPEVGSPIASARQFKWLYAYAPLVHLKKGTLYPATLVRTSTDDERVSPAHAFKFAATMQWAQGGLAPVLLYVARGTGHVGGGTLTDEATPLADEETFLLSAVEGRRRVAKQERSRP